MYDNKFVWMLKDVCKTNDCSQMRNWQFRRGSDYKRNEKEIWRIWMIRRNLWFANDVQGDAKYIHLIPNQSFG